MEPEKKLPVIYIITKLELGGAQKVCLSLFNTFNTQASPAWLISGTEGPLIEDVKNNENTFLLPSLKREICLNDLKAFWDIVKIITSLKKEYPNLVVHTHSTKAGYLGRWAAWYAGVKKIIHTVHGFGFHDHQSIAGYTIAYLLEKITSFITTDYICVSSVDIATGTKALPYFEKKYHLIRAAVQEYKLVPKKKDLSFNGSCVFGTIACFKPQKNLFDLLEAFKLVHLYQPEARLEIIGDGAQRPLLEAWITQNYLHKVITLHGWQAEPALLMKNWDCFVLSSLWEGLPCAAVEARFLQLPVISYNVGGIADLVIHGKNGYLCQLKNRSILAHYMKLLAQNNYLRLSLGSYKQNLEVFSSASMAAAHSELYRI